METRLLLPCHSCLLKLYEADLEKLEKIKSLPSDPRANWAMTLARDGDAFVKSIHGGLEIYRAAHEDGTLDWDTKLHNMYLQDYVTMEPRLREQITDLRRQDLLRRDPSFAATLGRSACGQNMEHHQAQSMLTCAESAPAQENSMGLAQR